MNKYVFYYQIIISQLADDTALFLKNVEQAKATEITELCELLAIHDCHREAATGIPIKTTVKYSGTHITKHTKLSETLNMEEINNCKSRLGRFLNRDL